ncbi:hypothetical protein JZ751_023003 [Albula glossodonta]|uniref:ZP-C domain-containing protein n=1 Tax=Albula glossodonta TaxID=121402 RepID=A0A8T2PMK9_9TELE|nr:hypothetical protein JZ751_023003 [Albula glossodonta]
MIKDIVQGSGTFHVTVQLLNGTSPLPQNYSLSPNEEVVVEVAINSTLDQIKLVIHECWATPTSDPADSTTYYFLQNSCPMHNTYTTVLENGNSSDCLDRRVRSGNTVAIARASCGPIYRSTEWTNHEMLKSFQDVIFIVVGVGLGVVILVVLTLVCYRKRRVGHYNFNFTPKQESFTYHVFGT